MLFEQQTILAAQNAYATLKEQILVDRYKRINREEAITGKRVALMRVLNSTQTPNVIKQALHKLNRQWDQEYDEIVKNFKDGDEVIHMYETEIKGRLQLPPVGEVKTHLSPLMDIQWSLLLGRCRELCQIHLLRYASDLISAMDIEPLMQEIDFGVSDKVFRERATAYINRSLRDRAATLHDIDRIETEIEHQIVHCFNSLKKHLREAFEECEVRGNVFVCCTIEEAKENLKQLVDAAIEVFGNRCADTFSKYSAIWVEPPTAEAETETIEDIKGIEAPLPQMEDIPQEVRDWLVHDNIHKGEVYEGRALMNLFNEFAHKDYCLNSFAKLTWVKRLFATFRDNINEDGKRVNRSFYTLRNFP